MLTLTKPPRLLTPDVIQSPFLLFIHLDYLFIVVLVVVHLMFCCYNISQPWHGLKGLGNLGFSITDASINAFPNRVGRQSGYQPHLFIA
jgi:Trk-type K+ transport system membrane component